MGLKWGDLNNFKKNKSKKLFACLIWFSWIFNIVGLTMYVINPRNFNETASFVFWMPVLLTVLSIKWFIERFDNDKHVDDGSWKACAAFAIVILICNFAFNGPSAARERAFKDYSKRHTMATEMCPGSTIRFPDEYISKCRTTVTELLAKGSSYAMEAVTNIRHAEEMSNHYNHRNYLKLKHDKILQNKNRNETFAKLQSCAYNWRKCKDLVSEHLTNGGYNDSIVTDARYQIIARYPANQSCLPVVGKCTYNKEKYEIKFTSLKKKRLGNLPVWHSDEEVLHWASYYARESIKTKKGSFKIWGNGTFDGPESFRWDVKYRVLESVAGYAPSQITAGKTIIVEADDMKTVCEWFSCEKRLEKKFKSIENAQNVIWTSDWTSE